MSPRTGRPTNDPKKNRLELRMSESEIEMLEYCCIATGLTKAEVIRQGIQNLYEKLQKKE